MQDLWNTIKRPNLWIRGVEEEEEMQSKGTGNLFNNILAENIPSWARERHLGIGDFSKNQTGSIQKETPPEILYLKY
jgi:hypothetical protein